MLNHKISIKEDSEESVILQAFLTIFNSLILGINLASRLAIINWGKPSFL